MNGIIIDDRIFPINNTNECHNCIFDWYCADRDEDKSPCRQINDIKEFTKENLLDLKDGKES